MPKMAANHQPHPNQQAPQQKQQPHPNQGPPQHKPPGGGPPQMANGPKKVGIGGNPQNQQQKPMVNGPVVSQKQQMPISQQPKGGIGGPQPLHPQKQQNAQHNGPPGSKIGPGGQIGPPNGGPPMQQQQGPPTTSGSGNGPRLPPGAVKVLPSNQQQQRGGPNNSGNEVAAKVRSYEAGEGKDSSLGRKRCNYIYSV